MANLTDPATRLRLGKRVLFVICLLPLARCAVIVLTGNTVNPVEFMTHSTGTWALVWLLVCLSMTPLRRLFSLSWPLKCRRMFGLFAFFYVALHFGTYLLLDQSLDITAMLKDVYKRPFITLGFAAFLLLLCLASTSTQGWMRRLKRHWGRLHRLVYPASVLAVAHYLWLVKKDLTQPMIYALILGGLLGLRMWWWLRHKQLN